MFKEPTMVLSQNLRIYLSADFNDIHVHQNRPLDNILNNNGAVFVETSRKIVYCLIKSRFFGKYIQFSKIIELKVRLILQNKLDIALVNNLMFRKHL